MVTEDYVSFDIAKLLKEKSFDEKCRTYYRVFPKDRIAAIYHSSEDKGVSKDDPNEILCPTLQMAMKWLREVHNISIEIFVIKNYDKKICEYTYTIMDLNFPGSDDGIDCCNQYKTYEQACETAIRYCLENLI